MVENESVIGNNIPREQHMKNKPHNPIVELENLLSNINNTNNQNLIKSESQS